MSTAVQKVMCSRLETDDDAPTQAEFDGAYVRLLERYGGLEWENLSELEREQLALLADDSEALHRWDQGVLHDWAASRGIHMGADAYLPNAPILYMARLLCLHGFECLEDALQALEVSTNVSK